MTHKINKVGLLSIVGAICALVFLVPVDASASPIIRSGDSVSVAVDQVLEGDFYGFGDTVSISGKSNEDVYVAGGTVTVNGEVAKDLVVAGGNIQIHAPVGDDVRAVGREVVIAGHITGDLVVAAQTLKILSTGSVDGDVLFAAGDVEITGSVAGSITGVGEKIRLDAGVGGNVSITAHKSFALGDRTEILGNLEYKSNSEVARSQGAVVVGDINKRMIGEVEDVSPLVIVMPLLVLLFAALTMYLLMKPRLERLASETSRSYGFQGLIGLAAVVGVPIVASILVVSLLGSIVGVILFLLYFVLVITSFIVAGILCGSLVMWPFIKTVKVNFVSVIIGMFVFSLLSAIPFVGPLLMLALYVIAFGGILTQIYHHFR